MLFMHKGAEACIEHAAYSGQRPKDNEESYVQIVQGDVDAAGFRVSRLTSMLGIPEDCVHGLLLLLSEWVKSTDYDNQAKNIYAMMHSDGMKDRAKQNKSANWRYYNNYIDLVLALYGEYCSHKNLEIENNVAKSILSSEKTGNLLKSVAKKISDYAEKNFEKKDFDGLLKGAYAPLHSEIDWEGWKNSYAGLKSEVLVPFLYDITSGFKKKLKWQEVPMAKGTINKDNMRMNVSTPEEDFDWTSSARWADVPIWAGPSYTAHLMLMVAQNAEVTPDEIRAFAYCIFAYWNACYPHTATPIHRMYGVMTTAREFGVPSFACNPKQMYLHAVSFTLS